ncbi:hypothetical protein POM88_047813 [Heracleum sosnowskyi]|uniref:Endoplasmic reticulum vesicle transporter C-terminal domain-containing protein n=1 Tax=Heracleum sosnowskyi TaxID=360622 RepID=A0AAD8M003_9APIA|nr:hypothetical protein POM88_047813 [Heracleum sosnowskyi]
MLGLGICLEKDWFCKYLGRTEAFSQETNPFSASFIKGSKAIRTLRRTCILLERFKISHKINRLAFGYFPGVLNPLDGVQWTQEPPSGMYQYFIKVVPTVYTDATGSTIQSNQ